MAGQIPVVDYLVLGSGGAHLQANRCAACGAQFFDRRNACAHCSGTEFTRVDLPTSGKVRSFTIVHRASPNVPTPYVSALIDLDGGNGTVKANVINTEPTPDRVTLGMAVRLATFVADVDSQGTEAVAFGFEPVNN
jgi:uncharacterized OB-fold protein